MSGAPTSSRATVVPRPSDRLGTLEEHGAGEAARHIEAGGIGAGVDPGSLVQGPAESRPFIHLVAGHGHDFQFDIQAQPRHQPACQFAEGESMAHDERRGADEALPARLQNRSLDGPTGGIGPVQYPDRLAGPGAGLQQVGQGGDEGVNAGADVLKVHQQDVEGLQHGGGRPAHLAIEAEDRDAVDRVTIVLGLDHVVLLIAAHAMLGAEGGGDGQSGRRHQGIQTGLARGRHGRRMPQQGQTPATQGLQAGAGEENRDAGLHGGEVPYRW
jgi:hypothetical protein